MNYPFESLGGRTFDAICADPPWQFRSRNAKQVVNPAEGRAIERHYATMTPAEIRALPVADLAKRDCHLFLWTTGPHLQNAFATMESWGFKYSGVGFTWCKLARRYEEDSPQMFIGPADFHVGMGYTTRKNTEICLLGRRGSPKRASASVRELIVAPVREHSRKPDTFRRRVDEYVGPGASVVELFARSQWPGWQAWGNETQKFEAVA